MKIKITVYCVVCAVLGLTTWVYFAHLAKNTLHPRTNQIPVLTKSQATVTAKSEVVRAYTPSVVNTKHVDVSPAIDSIADGRLTYVQRMGAIQAVTGRLTDKELKVLYDLLSQHDPGDDQQLGQLLKNSLMDALCTMNPPPAGLRNVLAQIYHDPNQNMVLRDYAVQHLVPLYRRMASAQDADSQTSADELKQTQAILWEAVNNTDSSIAGTALLGLSHLSQEGWRGFDQAEIGNAALKLAGDNNVGELSRITAFQVCARLNVTNALVLALGAAQSGETMPVQISAVAAIGALGGKDQIPLLNGLIQDGNDRLKLPAQRALSEINRRLKQTAKTS